MFNSNITIFFKAANVLCFYKVFKAIICIAACINISLFVEQNQKINIIYFCYLIFIIKKHVDLFII